MINDIKGSVRILSFLKNNIKVFSAIYGNNWQSLNILTTGETFAQNIMYTKNWEIALTYCQKNMECKSFSFLQKFLQNLEKIRLPLSKMEKLLLKILRRF